jgi:phosphatidylglycerol:prolipoprotein diacylglycerol transferase
MHPVLFKIGNISFYSHGVMIVLGIALGVVAAYFFSKKKELENEFLFDNIIYTILFGIIGARISYFLVYPEQFEGLLKLLYIWEGGLISYGGFVAGGLTFFLCLKIQRQPILKWFDALAVGFPVGIIFGRLGDIIAGDYFNSFQFNSLSSFLNGFPTPLYEALLGVIIFLVVLYLNLKRDNLVSGFVFFLTLLLYSGGRFIIDFWRNEKQILWDLSAGQIFGLVISILSIMVIILLLKTQKKGESYELHG